MKGLNQGNKGTGVNALTGHLEARNWAADMVGSGRDRQRHDRAW
jgi:hypothetical protein